MTFDFLMISQNTIAKEKRCCDSLQTSISPFIWVFLYIKHFCFSSMKQHVSTISASWQHVIAFLLSVPLSKAIMHVEKTAS